MPTTTNNCLRVAALALEVRPGERIVRLIPAGTFDAPRGAMAGTGPWHLSPERARDVIATAAARATDLVIDYEHQTLLSGQNGRPAPASGWVEAKALEWRPDGLYGPITWTAAAARAIDAGEYRYLSPVFSYDTGGNVIELLHVALTNTPAIDGEQATLAAARAYYTQAQSHPQEDIVDKATLIKLLDLTPEAKDTDIEAAIAALKDGAVKLAVLMEEDATPKGQAGDGTGGDARAELKRLRDAGMSFEDISTALAAISTEASRSAGTLSAIDSGEITNPPESLIEALKSIEPPAPDTAAAKAKAAQLGDTVPRAVYEEATAQLAALKATGEKTELDRLIEEGLSDGRIAGQATATWLRKQGLAALTQHLQDAPGVAALKATQTGGKPPAGDSTTLSAAEIAVCKAMGITPEAYQLANAS
ncbi:MAG: phage protease [Pseudomonadales bacterium]|nr:phage protease [Pseudomonadales bacterium]